MIIIGTKVNCTTVVNVKRNLARDQAYPIKGWGYTVKGFKFNSVESGGCVKTINFEEITGDWPFCCFEEV